MSINTNGEDVNYPRRQSTRINAIND